MAITTILEFFDTHVQIAVTDIAKGKTVFRGATVIDFSIDGDTVSQKSAVVSAAKEFLKSLRVPQLSAARILLPKSMVMVRKVTLPSILDDELIGMAKFEAERHIPLNADRQIIDYAILSKNGVEGSDVVLGAVDHAILSEYVDIVKRIGLVIEYTLVTPLVLLSSICSCKDYSASQLQSGIILNLGETVSDITVICDGNFLMTRSINVTVKRLLEDFTEVGIQSVSRSLLGDLDAFGIDADEKTDRESFTLDSHYYPVGAHTDCPDPALSPDGAKSYVMRRWLTNLIKDIRRTTDFARREFEIAMPSHVFIVGMGSGIPRLASFIKTKTGLATDVYIPMKYVEDKAGVSSDNISVGVLANSMAAALFTEKPLGNLDLVLPEYIEAGRKQRRRQSWIITGLLAVVLLIMGYFYIYDLFKYKSELLEQYKTENVKMKSEVVALNDKDSRLKLIQSVADDKRGPLKILEFLSSQSMIPSDITLTSFEYKKSDYVKIQGHGKSNVRVNEFLALLDNSGYFDRIVPDPSTNSDEVLPNRADRVKKIDITAYLKKDAKSAASTGTKPERR